MPTKPAQSLPAVLPSAVAPASKRAARSAVVKHAAVSKSAGRPRAAEVEARLDELKHIAGQLFLHKGYGNVSLEMIAREARVAVRTIYVKFGGKSGLLAAVLKDKRQRFFADMDMEKDPRPLKEVLNDFAARFYTMLTTPAATSMQRMLAAEANSNPELVETFFAEGPNVSRDAIARFLHRPDVRAQLRDDLPFEQLPVYLINCILGDQMSRVLLNPDDGTPEHRAAALAQRMELFYRSVLR
ncbi:TetR/AcrR family transcriptional regulator [Paucibacter sp. Y2R2-4]|uniref:TetR/AcrR family transcriptional regulator n=1 Tax=Paucibacter sp. Y2R2-4 TaxID=2893553 RepID=UPI0021E4B4E3|nr:TetR/AcrR family transcriptional regulator [Paucibacter sp. Y2R2-4]MCV2348309.1 TetR/AcrR family transcriptional regulator [Paucibacter sp. Y2R2-4]